MMITQVNERLKDTLNMWQNTEEKVRGKEVKTVWGDVNG